MLQRFLLPFLLAPALLQAEPAVSALKAVTTVPDARYEVGENATFEISGAMPGELTCVFSKDGIMPQPPQVITADADGDATITGTLDEPGFLNLRVTQGQTAVLAAAGFSPHLITPTGPPPDDFDDFWDKQKALLKAVPMQTKMEPVTTPMAGVEAFDIKVDCLGAPVSGYFGRPQAKAAPKSLPALLYVHGAGVASSNLASINWVAHGMLALDINAHGIDNGKSKEYYDELSATSLKEYSYQGRTSPEECYFKGMFLRLIRAIDFIAAQPEWDGKTLIVYGSSQGGYQAFAAAGLDARVSFFCAGVPAGCDHNGFEAVRVAGWPKLVEYISEGRPNPASVRTARYFDAVNFAIRAKCQGAAVTVGYIDAVCPPTSVYAAYNALNIPKTMHADPLVGHTNSDAASKFMQAAALRHAKGQ